MILPMPVVSNTSPIWNLASLDRLDLLHDQFPDVRIPQDVLDELQVGHDYPEMARIEHALDVQWLTVESLANPYVQQSLMLEIDRGEAAAIALALDALIGAPGFARRRRLDIGTLAGAVATGRRRCAVLLGVGRDTRLPSGLVILLVGSLLAHWHALLLRFVQAGQGHSANALPIEQAALDRFGNVGAANPLALVQIRNGARDPQDFDERAGAQPQLRGSGFQQSLAITIQGRHLLELAPTEERIGGG